MNTNLYGEKKKKIEMCVFLLLFTLLVTNACIVSCQNACKATYIGKGNNITRNLEL